MASSRYRFGRELLERQRERCCAVLDAVSPDAPTLCQGWTAFDLAAHLDALCRDPLSWPGIGLAALAPVTERRARRLQQRLGYPGLVRRLRRRSPLVPLFGIDPWLGWPHHLGEWFVHTEDVRRANELPPAEPDAAVDAVLWQRVQAAARILCRRGDGLVLRHPDGREARVADGPRPRLVTGAPGELMIYVYRGRAAEVRVEPAG
ncbi:MAG: maleylpyruvate isomerase family mycothiol-dependent enzyme [Micropruina sp.]|uniref:maleylpyruvate isomerase family mycothiol-dependent enzyme n=1 Tax=Micropruina sp. TaxID=2737536 RepID=UPI0039E6B4CE